MAHNNLLAYPDYNKEFEINTNAINLQLEAVIRQEVKINAFYSKKSTSPPKRYTVTEKELIRIIEMFKEY